MAFRLTVNGKSRNVDVEPGTPLLWVLRDTVGLLGTKFGCGCGLCGCCTVHLDGKAVRACQTKIETVGERKVTTIEGIGETEIGKHVASAMRDFRLGHFCLALTARAGKHSTNSGKVSAKECCGSVAVLGRQFTELPSD